GGLGDGLGRRCSFGFVFGALEVSPKNEAEREKKMLQVQELGLEAIRELKPLVVRTKTFDRDLANQLVRAASSVVLNIAEGHGNRAGNRRLRYESAQGSAIEVRAGLAVAIGWGSVAEEDAATAARLLDSVVAMLWKLARPRR